MAEGSGIRHQKCRDCDKLKVPHLHHEQEVEVQMENDTSEMIVSL